MELLIFKKSARFPLRYTRFYLDFTPKIHVEFLYVGKVQEKLKDPSIPMWKQKNFLVLALPLLKYIENLGVKTG